MVTHVILPLGKQKQEDQDLVVILAYIASLGYMRDTLAQKTK